MRAVSLFSGVGGFDLGFERAGITTVAQVEIDTAARGVLADHWPDVPRFTDVTQVTGSELPDHDILCGGFPCQDLSVAGRRAGLDGGRSGLYWQIVRLLGECRTRWVVLENVPGLLSANAGWDMAAVVDSLVQLGYGVAWRVLNSQHFGVPQRRRRVFIVGHLGSRRAEQVLLEPAGGGWDSTPRRETREDVAGTLGGGSGSRGWAPDTERMTFIPTTTHTLTGEGHDASEDGTGRGTPLVPATARCLTTSNERIDGETETFIVAEDWDGGLRLRSQSDTLNTQQARRDRVKALTPLGVRRLTPKECERLQGFPDGWTATSGGKPQADSARYRQLGNAVTVPVAEWVGRRLKQVDAS